MTRGVVYMLLGAKHAVHLAVSLCSLRQWYDGPVCVLCDMEGYGWARWIIEPECADDVERVFDYQIIFDQQLNQPAGKLLKTLVPSLSPYDATLFLDADTLVVGDIGELWPIHHELVLTQFSDWLTTRNRMRRRIAEWSDIEPMLAAHCLHFGEPVINTGVMAWERGAAVLEEWRKLAWKRPDKVGRYDPTDELALQLVFREYPSRILDCRWNASVVFDWMRPDVRIWHAHGLKAWRRQTGRDIYLPFYESLLQENRCGIRSIPLPEKCVRSLPAEDRERLAKYWTWSEPCR